MLCAGFDFLNRHRRAAEFFRVLDPEQAADGEEPLGLVVHGLCEFAILVRQVGAHRVLQRADRFRRPCVILAAHAHGVVAADRKRIAIDRCVAEREAMSAKGLFGDFGEADAFDARCRAGEIGADKIRPQADGIENLRAAIGLIGRDAHLGHHLQQALVDRLDVALDDFLVVELLRQIALHRDQRFKREIGVDRFRAVAGETGEVMNFARLAGFDDKPDRRAQALADQMMMHRRAAEQRRRRNAVDACGAVRQDDDVDAVAHSLFGLVAQPRQRPIEARRAELGLPRHVEGDRLEVGVAHLRDRADFLEILVGEDRLAHFEPLGVRHVFEVEQVRPRPDDRNEAHDEFFADRIDRRVRHLREVLLEIGEQRLRLVRQRRDRRVIAH